MTDEQPELRDIDVRNNPESKAYAGDATQRASRASEGPPPRDAPAAGEMPEIVTGGTEAGNPVAGLEIDPADLEEAVEPDQDAMDVDGPVAGHA